MCGYQDTAKRTLLREQGLKIGGEWSVKGFL